MAPDGVETAGEDNGVWIVGQSLVEHGAYRVDCLISILWASKILQEVRWQILTRIKAIPMSCAGTADAM